MVTSPVAVAAAGLAQPLVSGFLGVAVISSHVRTVWNRRVGDVVCT